MSAFPEASEATPSRDYAALAPEIIPAELFDLFGSLDSTGHVVKLSGRVFDLTNIGAEMLSGQGFTETV
ncbi:MAG TPA: hypothetical protein DEA22_02420, partial [Blastocatellia bacterium]|nr:hypothetical protein [Blastocatellia bacterium]